MDRYAGIGHGLGDLAAIGTWLYGQVNRICCLLQRPVEPPIGYRGSTHHQNKYDNQKKTHSPTNLEKTWEE